MTSEWKLDRRMRLLDMHAHLFCMADRNGKTTDENMLRTMAEWEIALRREMGVITFLSSGTPWEWKFMRQFARSESLLFSFGIHPWYAEQYMAVEQRDLEDAYRMCDAVGEIGMDCVWCEIPLSVQRAVLERQLQIAADLKKPVILHAKGMEAEISDMLQGFPEPVCVHWYSGDLKSLEKFLEQDCYFTLGPDLAGSVAGEEKRSVNGLADAENSGLSVWSGERASRELYQYMLREIPVNRLFVETDGVSAIAWANGQEDAEFQEIQKVLDRNIDCIAAVKKMQGDELRERMWKNLIKFLGKSEKGLEEELQSEARMRL